MWTAGNSLQVFDVSNPLAAPVFLASYDTGQTAYDLTLSADGMTAYVANGLRRPDDSGHLFASFRLRWPRSPSARRSMKCGSWTGRRTWRPIRAVW